MKAKSPLNAKQIRHLRDSLGFSQAELAEMAHVSTRTIERIEAGKQETTSTSIARKIAKALGVPLQTITLHYGLDKSPPPWDLIGRQPDLAAITTLLCQQDLIRPAACVLTGAPGIGKTTLATTIAYDPQIKSAFHYVYFFTLGPAPSIITKLRDLAIAAGLPELALLSDVQSLRDRITRALSNKKVLLVLDDVWEPTHVMPFPFLGTGSATLVTTRHAKLAPTIFTTHSVHKLLPLSPEASAELFYAFGPDVCRDSHEVQTLIHNLGGHPLGLIVAASYLQRLSDDTEAVIRDAAIILETGELMAAQTPVDISGVTPTLYAVFDRSISQLAPDVQKTFRNLAPFALGADFDLAAAESVCDTTDIHDHLSELKRFALLNSKPNPLSNVTPDEDDQLYYLHQLMASVARYKLQNDFNPRSSCFRHVKHYLRTATAINEQYNQGGELLQLGLMRLRSRLPQITQAIEWGSEYAGNPDFDELCTRQVLLANEALWNCLPPLEYIACLDQAAAAAKRLELRQERVTLLLRAAALRIELGHLTRAVEDATWAAHASEHYTGTKNKALANACLGLAAQYRDNYSRSIQFFQRAVEIFSSLSAERAVAITKQNLAVSFAEAGQMNEAAKALDEAQTLQREIRDPRLDALLEEKQARTGLTDGSPLRLLKHALHAFDECGYPLGTVRVLITLGDYYRHANRPDKSFAAYSEAAEVARGIEATPYLALAHLGAAKLHQHLGQLVDASSEAKRAFSIFDQLQNQPNKKEAADIIKQCQ